jgi:hypothetical protein
MSRRESSEIRTRNEVSQFTRASSRAGAAVAAGIFLAVAISCVAIAIPSCGGTQGPVAAQPAEAGAEASGPIDFCAEQRTHTYASIASFENYRNNQFDLAASPNPGNSQQNPSYVSFDLTGSMYGCDTQNLPDTAPPLLNPGLCDQPDAQSSTRQSGDGVVSAIGCKTGYNAVAEVAPDGHCLVDGGTSRAALHLVGSDLSDWGMNLGVELRQNCNNDIDPEAGSAAFPCYVNARLEQFKGISLWARLGSDDPSLATTAIVQIGDPATSSQLGGSAGMLVGQYPFNGWPLDGGPVGPPLCGDTPCNPGVGPPPKSPVQCDPFSKGISLSTEWQFYTIPFDEMQQKGYGLPENEPDLEHFLGVKFSLSKGQIGSAHYDVWLNDISFYK